MLKDSGLAEQKQMSVLLEHIKALWLQISPGEDDAPPVRAAGGEARGRVRHLRRVLGDSGQQHKAPTAVFTGRRGHDTGRRRKTLHRNVRASAHTLRHVLTRCLVRGAPAGNAAAAEVRGARAPRTRAPGSLGTRARAIQHPHPGAPTP